MYRIRFTFVFLLWIWTLPVSAIADSALAARGYSVRTLDLKPGFDGTSVALLISKPCLEPSQKAVLYVHGYNDYFFQHHLADWYLAQGFNFYALELRRYGRTLLPGQIRYDVRRISEYFEELDIAMDTIRNRHRNTFVLLNGHSMGGLVTALYASDRSETGTIDALFLNSPFFDLYAGWVTRNILSPVLSGLGAIFPRMKLPVSGTSFYGESLHKDYRGEWDYDLILKPMNNTPRIGWLRAIRKAHKTVRKGLSVKCPVLVMHSDKSGSDSEWNDLIPVTDVVLNVDDIAKRSLQLGKSVEIVTIPQAKHDIMLSSPAVRSRAFEALERWIQRVK